MRDGQLSSVFTPCLSRNTTPYTTDCSEHIAPPQHPLTFEPASSQIHRITSTTMKARSCPYLPWREHSFSHLCSLSPVTTSLKRKLRRHVLRSHSHTYAIGTTKPAYVSTANRSTGKKKSTPPSASISSSRVSSDSIGPDPMMP